MNIKSNTYYIKLETDSNDIFHYDAGILGESNNTSFYPNKGFTRLIKLVNEFPQLLETIIIIDEKSKKYTVQEFLRKIEKLKLIIH